MPGRFCCGDGGEDGPAVGGAAYMWCVTGDWAAYGCVGLVYVALLSIDVTVSLFCIRPMFGLETAKGQLHMAGFQFLVFMVVYSHLSASWSDPGLVSKDPSGTFQQLHKMELDHAKELEALGDGGAALKLAKKRFCNKCKSFKPKGAHHCSLCGRCVRKMDHHCPWINNCVGERNWKSFFLFLCYVTIGTLYAIVMYIMRAHGIVNSTKPADRASPYSKNVLIFIVVMCMISFIFACAFLAFVMCMFYDQYEALTTGVPGVDAMQTTGDLPRVQSCFKGFRSMVVADEPFSVRWFLPVAPRTLRRNAPPQPPVDDREPDFAKWEAHFDQLGLKPDSSLADSAHKSDEPEPSTAEGHTTFAGRNLMEDGRALMDEAEQMLADAMQADVKADQATTSESVAEVVPGHQKTE